MMYVMTYEPIRRARPATIGFLKMLVNGHPPQMIARKNVVGTAITANCTGIGPGGEMPSPTIYRTTNDMTAAAMAVTMSIAIPLTGWTSLATNDGFAPAQITTATIWKGIRQRL